MGSWNDKRATLRLAQGQMAMFQNVASTALAIEAIETLLIDKGIIKDGDVLERIDALLKQKSEQVKAATEPSRIITPV